MDEIKEGEDERKLFLENLKNGRIIIADTERTEEGIKYYYIQKIC